MQHQTRGEDTGTRKLPSLQLPPVHTVRATTQMQSTTSCSLPTPERARTSAGIDTGQRGNAGETQAFIPPWSPSIREFHTTSGQSFRGSTSEILTLTFKLQCIPVSTSIHISVVFDHMCRVAASVEGLADDMYHYRLFFPIPILSVTNRAMPLVVELTDDFHNLLAWAEAGWFYYVPITYERELMQASPSASAVAYLPGSRVSTLEYEMREQEFSVAHSIPPLFEFTFQNPATSSASKNVPARSSPLQRSDLYSGTPADSHLGYRSEIRDITVPPQQPTSSRKSDAAWVRISELRQRKSSFGINASNMTSNTYSQYRDAKAKLIIFGDLKTMTESWTRHEHSARRRLAEFQRSQSGSTIEASFKPVTSEDRNAANPCISCIYWARQKTFYFTSVDAIALLEGLVAVIFTVEEKKRIRRNLAGLKPLTASKNNDDTEDVFRLIVGFGNPKPRTIEKDIKVFPWAILKVALRKVIGKYSSSVDPISSSIGQSSNAALDTPTYMEIAKPRGGTNSYCTTSS